MGRGRAHFEVLQEIKKKHLNKFFLAEKLD